MRQLITENNLKKLLKKVKDYKSDSDVSVGKLREEIAYAVDKQHLHKGAFALIRKLDGMSPEKLSEFLDHFDHYLLVSGLEARAESVERLPLGDGPGEEADDGEENGAVKNPILKSSVEYGEGSVVFPSNWRKQPALLRADILKDWIGELTEAYDDAVANLMGPPPPTHSATIVFLPRKPRDEK